MAKRRPRSFLWWWHVLVTLSALAWGTYFYILFVELREARRMEQKPLWKIDSGEFAGWRMGDALHDAKGTHIGMFRGDVAYTLKGDYLGEIVNGEWLGQHIARRPPPIAAREQRGSVHSVPRAARSGRPSKLWKDPKI